MHLNQNIRALAAIAYAHFASVANISGPEAAHVRCSLRDEWGEVWVAMGLMDDAEVQAHKLTRATDDDCMHPVLQCMQFIANMPGRRLAIQRFADCASVLERIGDSFILRLPAHGIMLRDGEWLAKTADGVVGRLNAMRHG